MISTLREDTTHIAYPETDYESAKRKLLFEFASSDKYIPSYMEGTYRVKGEPNPYGSETMYQVTPDKDGRSQWHTTEGEFNRIWEGASDGKKAAAFQKALDLPKEPGYYGTAINERYWPAYINPDESIGVVEISFTVSGIPQIRISPNDNVDYSPKKPIP